MVTICDSCEAEPATRTIMFGSHNGMRGDFELCRECSEVAEWR